MNLVLLSGGSGQRLWPLSNDIRSKQFIKIFHREDGELESMVQRVYRQIKAVDAGHQMNYHSHQHRDEVWTVIAGKGKTIVDGMEQNVKAGDVITMSAGCRHTVIAETELKLIEVQLGEAIDVHDKQKFELEY